MKIALVLGGTDDHIRLIEILKNKGYYTVLVDYFENPPAKQYADKHIVASTTDKEKVLEIALNENAKLVIATCIDSALANAAYVSEILSLPFHIDYSTALALTDKTLMKEVFIKHNIPTAKYIVFDGLDFDNLDDLIYPLVVKPSDANSSKGVTKVNNKNEMLNAIEIAMSFSSNKKVIIEEYKEGEEFSVDIMVHDGKATLLMATKNIKSHINENNFTIIQSKYPATDDKKLLDQLTLIAEKIAKAYNIKNSPLLIQIIHNQGELNVIEFSARIGGGSKHQYIKKICGFDILKDFVNIINEEPNQPIETNYSYKNAVINYTYVKPGEIKYFINFTKFLEDKIIEEIFYYKKQGTVIKGSANSGDRPLGYLVIGNSEKELHEKLLSIDRNVKIMDGNGNDLMIHSLFN